MTSTLQHYNTKAVSEFRCLPHTGQSNMESVSTFNEDVIVGSESTMKTSKAFQPHVIVEPKDSLSDQKVDIKILNLPAGAEVTLRAQLTSDAGDIFESFARYVASEDGSVSVTNDVCHGGTYTGVEPMGLLWSMKPTEGQRKGLRLSKRDVTKPYEIQLDVFKGVKGSDGTMLSSATFRRHFMGKGVRRIPVRTGRVRGTLFLPPGNQKFPGVIDMFGTAGGLLEFKASLLASHGFATFALAYFGYDDLPKVVTDVSLEYFEEALEWFSQHEKVRPGGVGLMGVSKGSELVLTLASHRPKLVRAVVAISPAHAIIAVPLWIRGEPSPFVKFEPEFTRMSPDGGIEWLDTYPDNISRGDVWHPAVIPVEKIECPIMLVSGEDDKSWHSTQMGDLIMRRMRKYKKQHQCIHHRYHGTGHLIEPPYTPHCKNSYHKAYRMLVHWGGEAKPHCKAQEKSWQNILEFFHLNISRPTMKSNL